MKRLRTTSSPYLQPLSDSQTDLSGANGELDAGDRIAAIGLDRLKAKGNLLPLLPIPPKSTVQLFCTKWKSHLGIHRMHQTSKVSPAVMLLISLLIMEHSSDMHASKEFRIAK